MRRRTIPEHRPGSPLPALLLAGLAAWSAACRRDPPPSPPAPFSPDFAGCAAVRADGVCEISPAQRTLHLITGERPEPAEARFDGQPLPTTEHTTAGAHRLTVVLPEPAAAPSAAGALTLDVGAPSARRRFTLRTEGARPDERVERARALAAEGKLPAAREALGDPEAYAAPVRGRARGRLARIDLASGDVDAAIRGLGRACDENLAAGRVSDAALDAFALSHTLLADGRSFDEARAALARAAPALAAWPEGRAQVGYYEALVARDAGDVRTALRRLGEAEEAAARLALDSMWRAAVQVRAKLLQALGRPDEAIQALDAAARATPATVPACERARLDTTRAWVELSTLLAARAPAAPGAALRERLLRLVDVFARDCPRPADVQNAQVNLAIVALLSGDTGAAAAHLAAARAVTAAPLSSVSAWMLELDGRLLLARGRPRDALAPFEELSARASAAGDPETAWRAQLGAGRAHLAAGSRDAAIEALRRAERTLDRWSAAVPLQAGRARFLGDRDASARALVEALLAAGRPGEALDAARTARVRTLVREARIDRVGSLPAEARARWEAALGRYEKARRAVDSAAEDDWKLAQTRLEEALAKRQALLADAERALDDALAELSWVAPGKAPSSPAGPGGGAMAAPKDGALLLAVFEQAERGYVLFVHDGKKVDARPLPEPSGLSREALSAALLEPIAPALASASRVVFLGYGAWQSVDVHALPLRGAPLAAHVPVAYGLDIGEGAAPRARGAAVVVADPTGDLPQAGREGERVAAHLGQGRKVTLLRGAGARKPAVLDALRGAEIFHFAGHGVFGEDAVSGSGLLMAGARLLAGDVLALGGAPRVVVLSGCETGRAPSRLGVDMSLAYAFLASGAEAVVATSRPVADTLAAAMSDALYQGVAAPEWEPASALRQAQERVRGADPGADWASYRVLVR